MNITVNWSLNCMNNIFNRVADWNSKRYDQVYDKDLAIRLLREEYKEWLDTSIPVDELDAICDITYVAFGVMWKHKLPYEIIGQQLANTLTALSNMLDYGEFNVPPVLLSSSALDALEYDYTSVLVACTDIIAACTMQALYMGLNEEQWIEALNIVCDANDSKSIKKVAANVKANAGDKGPYFVSPEVKLQALLNRASEENKDVL